MKKFFDAIKEYLKIILEYLSDIVGLTIPLLLNLLKFTSLGMIFFIIISCVYMYIAKPEIPFISVKSNQITLFGNLPLFLSEPEKNEKSVSIGINNTKSDIPKESRQIKSNLLTRDKSSTSVSVSSPNEESVNYNINDSDHIGNLISQNSFFISILFTFLGIMVTVATYIGWRQFAKLKVEWSSLHESLQKEEKENIAFTKLQEDFRKDPKLRRKFSDEKSLKEFTTCFFDRQADESTKFYFAGKDFFDQIKRNELDYEKHFSKEDLHKLQFCLDYFSVAEERMPFIDGEYEEVRHSIYHGIGSVFKELGSYYFFKSEYKISLKNSIKALIYFEKAIGCNSKYTHTINNYVNTLLDIYQVTQKGKVDVGLLKLNLQEALIPGEKYDFLEGVKNENQLGHKLLDVAIESLEPFVKGNHFKTMDESKDEWYYYNYAMANFFKLQHELKINSPTNWRSELINTASNNCNFREFIIYLEEAIKSTNQTKRKYIESKIKRDPDLKELFNNQKEPINSEFEAILKKHLN